VVDLSLSEGDRFLEVAAREVPWFCSANFSAALESLKNQRD